MNKKILVAGGGGFIGGHLVNFYQKKGFKVYSVDLKKKINGFRLIQK
jgi:nucleoside-diphosphate-sugar epimerase|tara:strand:- start:305 stop:445 length:141 start_codon:yes stop_codon:yes gene_type:complete